MTTKPVIQVGVDGSWRQTGALEWALQESLLDNVPLRAVHVIDENVRQGPFYEPIKIDDSAMQLVKDVQQYLTDSGALLDQQADLVVGPPDTTLAELAEGSRMLVVGRRGMGTFKRLLIGSTSEAVANQARVPVIVVPDGWKPPQQPGPVVVGLDDSGESDPAIEFAVYTAVERHVPLHLVHAWNLQNVYGWDSMNLAGAGEEWEEAAERHFEAIAEQWRHKYPELEIQIDIHRGHPVQRLVEAAESSNAQLLVVGGHDRRRLTGALVGAVVRGVLQHATCPVAIIHTSPEGS